MSFEASLRGTPTLLILRNITSSNIYLTTFIDVVFRRADKTVWLSAFAIVLLVL